MGVLGGHEKSERGATALLAALLAVVLFGIGAIVIDLGEAWAKKSLEQTSVDLAVMAATAELKQDTGCNPEVVDKATEFLKGKLENTVAGQYPLDLGGSAGDGNGFIECPGNWRVRLVAPASRVDYGLAGVLGVDDDHVDVTAEATAQIKSPSRNYGLPMFGVTGCDYGSQVIRDDSGPAAPEPPVPALTPNSATFNNATFTISPDSQATPNTPTQVTLTGTNLDGATAVAFTGAGGPPDHHEVLAADFVSATATKIVVSVPAAVLAIEDVWFVRVVKGGLWSEQSKAQRFNVGAPRLYCASSSEGNFGTLDLPRPDTSHDLEWNMIFGPIPALEIHPSPAGECGGDGPPTVESKTAPVDGTNCIATEPGIKIAAANDGLISGKGGKDGRLDKDSTSNCSRNGDNGRTPTAIKGEYINDDLLSCFIINDARINDLVLGNAKGTEALSGDIFNSPRYFWIPIVATEPSTGKKSWPIVDFRPGFITDQTLSATNASPGPISTHNGLVAEPSGLRELNVILFDKAALPEFAPATGGEIDYTGSGPKVIVLVD